MAGGTSVGQMAGSQMLCLGLVREPGEGAGPVPSIIGRHPHPFPARFSAVLQASDLCLCACLAIGTAAGRGAGR